MQRLPALRPTAAAIAALSTNPAAHRHTARATLLPLGAMVAAMAFSMDAALAQTAAGAQDKQGNTAGAPAQQEATMPTITVTDVRDREAIGYQGGKTSVGKSAQLARDIPQSVTIISSQLMHDRNADTMKEALRNVAGLTFNAGEGGRIGDNITLRGYSAVGDLYLDNMRDIAQYNRESFNLEQIDVLRGSASMLYGRGSTGGLINQVSKQPDKLDRNEAAVTVGSYDYKRLTADINQSIGTDMAARINVMKTDTDSFRDGPEAHRWGIAPSIRWGIGTDNDFTLSYYYLKEDNIPDMGVPYFNNLPLDVPSSRFYGMASYDYEKNETGIATLSHTHRFDRDTNLRTVVRAANYKRDLRAVAPRLVAGTTVITDATAINRQRQSRGGKENTITAQSDFNTRFELGGMKHQLLAGVELVKEQAERWTNGSTALSPLNPPTTVGNPNIYDPLPAGAAFPRDAFNYYTANTVGIYAQDTIEFAPKWKLVLGARHDNFRASYDRQPNAAEITAGVTGLVPYKRSDKEWSYRTGLLYQPTDTASYYASYGTSFNPSAELYQLDDRSVNTPPEKNRNIELGAKWDLADGDLSLRTAIFRSEKTNERNTDLASPNIFLMSGKRHTDGIEFEAAGRITPAWEMFGSVALMRGKIDVAAGTAAATQGNVPINTPDYTYSLWSTYKLSNWKLGGGIEGVGLRYGSTANTNASPSYVRVDALVQYEMKKSLIKLNVFNLFDKVYYESVYAGHAVPGTARAVQLTFETKF